jgi:TatA/E family protein of Tat protein translocase
MEIFGIGPLELILVLIIALMVFGPDKLPEIGAKLGKAMRSMREATHDFSKEIEETRQALEASVQDIKAPFQEASAAVQPGNLLLRKSRPAPPPSQRQALLWLARQQQRWRTANRLRKTPSTPARSRPINPRLFRPPKILRFPRHQSRGPQPLPRSNSANWRRQQPRISTWTSSWQ